MGVVKNVIWMKSQCRDVIINDIHLKNIKFVLFAIQEYIVFLTVLLVLSIVLIQTNSVSKNWKGTCCHQRFKKIMLEHIWYIYPTWPAYPSSWGSPWGCWRWRRGGGRAGCRWPSGSRRSSATANLLNVICWFDNGCKFADLLMDANWWPSRINYKVDEGGLAPLKKRQK